MDRFGDSFKSQKQDISSKKQLFYEFLQNKYHIHSYDIITEDNLPFLKVLSPKTLLYEIYRKSYDSVEGSLTLDIFIDDIIQNILLLHDKIVAETANVNKIKENVRVLDAILEKMEEKTKNLEQNNEQIKEPLMFFISYVKDKKYDSEIFDFCHIKYKVSTSQNSDKLFSIYSEKKKSVCQLAVNQNIDMIFIHVLGKKKYHFFNNKEDFDIIATADLPVINLFSFIKPIYFELEEIPPIYQIIKYEYELEENFVQEKKEINSSFELKFEIKANNIQKIQIIKTLLEYYPELIENLESNINKRINLIQELLMPFDEQVVYDQNGDVFLKKNHERGCTLDVCVLI